MRHADAWVATVVRERGFPPASQSGRAEEWLSGPFPVASWLTEVIGTLTLLDAGEDLLAGC